MPQFGLIGYPIDHSMSPALFKAAYGGRYRYRLIIGEDFERSWQRFIDRYDGINVTAPFKELAMQRADMVSPECVRTGAANVIARTASGTMAFNSDYSAVRMCIDQAARQEGLNLSGASGDSDAAGRNRIRCGNALIVGCGGAGKAAAVAALDMGMTVTIVNRTMDRAESFAEHLFESYYSFPEDGSVFSGDRHPGIFIRPVEQFCEAFDMADVVIYTLPRALPQLYDLPKRQVSVPDDQQDGFSREGRAAIVLEANYRDPSFDKQFRRRMEESGRHLCYVSGLRWLVYQAYTGYGHFTGEAPDLKSMLKLFGR